MLGNYAFVWGTWAQCKILEKWCAVFFFLSKIDCFSILVNGKLLDSRRKPNYIRVGCQSQSSLAHRQLTAKNSSQNQFTAGQSTVPQKQFTADQFFAKNKNRNIQYTTEALYRMQFIINCVNCHAVNYPAANLLAHSQKCITPIKCRVDKYRYAANHGNIFWWNPFGE
jgi:hypothetical protein